MTQVAEACDSRIIGISRRSPNFYDRRDVLTRGRVTEIALSGLTEDELSEWIQHMDIVEEVSSEVLHERTGGHPLAIELLEMYGEVSILIGSSSGFRNRRSSSFGRKIVIVDSF